MASDCCMVLQLLAVSVLLPLYRRSAIGALPLFERRSPCKQRLLSC